MKDINIKDLITQMCNALENAPEFSEPSEKKRLIEALKKAYLSSLTPKFFDEKLHNLMIKRFSEIILNIDNQQELSELKFSFSAKNGFTSLILKKLREVPSNERPEIGNYVNKFVEEINKCFKEAQNKIKKIEALKADKEQLISQDDAMYPENELLDSDLDRVFEDYYDNYEKNQYLKELNEKFNKLESKLNSLEKESIANHKPFLDIVSKSWFKDGDAIKALEEKINFLSKDLNAKLSALKITLKSNSEEGQELQKKHDLFKSEMQCFSSENLLSEKIKELLSQLNKSKEQVKKEINVRFSPKNIKNDDKCINCNYPNIDVINNESKERMSGGQQEAHLKAIDHFKKYYEDDTDNNVLQKDVVVHSNSLREKYEAKIKSRNQLKYKLIKILQDENLNILLQDDPKNLKVGFEAFNDNKSIDCKFSISLIDEKLEYIRHECQSAIEFDNFYQKNKNKLCFCICNEPKTSMMGFLYFDEITHIVLHYLIKINKKFKQEYSSLSNEVKQFLKI